MLCCAPGEGERCRSECGRIYVLSSSAGGYDGRDYVSTALSYRPLRKFIVRYKS